MNKISRYGYCLKVITLLISSCSYGVDYFAPPTTPPLVLNSGDTLTVNGAFSTAVDAVALTITGNTTVRNFGTMQNTSAPPAFIIQGTAGAGPVTITNNPGALMNQTNFVTPAVDLQNITGSPVTFTNNAGRVIGFIRLPDGVDSTAYIISPIIDQRSIFREDPTTPPLFGTVNFSGDVTQIVAGKIALLNLRTVNVIGNGTQLTLVGNDIIDTMVNVNSFNINAGTTAVIGLPLINFQVRFLNVANIINNGTMNLQNGILSSPNISTNGTINITPPSTFDGTLNINGGNINGDIVITPLRSLQINVNQNFTTGGNITIAGPPATITVFAPANFTINHLVTANTFLINPQATVTMNNTITVPTLTNHGTLALTNTQNLTGNYLQDPGIFQTTLNNATPGNFGRLQVNGTADVQGTVQVQLANNGFNIQNGDTFDVLTSTGALNDTSTLVQPASAVLSFVKTSNPPPNIIRLTATRISFTQANPNPIFDPLSQAIDQMFASGPPFSPLLAALAAQPNASALAEALAQLAPQGLNGGVTQTTFLALDKPLEKLTGAMQKGFDFYSGYSAGDFAIRKGTHGPMLFGGGINQKTRNGLSGYTSGIGGVGIFSDLPIYEWGRLGFAVAYARSSVRQSDATRNFTNIQSYQGFFYGNAIYGPLFADGIMGIGYNLYQGARNILFLGQTARARYQGTQFGAKVRAGFSLPFFGGSEISPIGQFDFATVRFRGYTETGAPDANLVVAPLQVSQIQVGVGLKIADVSQDDFLPEIHALALADVQSPNVHIQSQFLTGGPGFLLVGPPPPKSGYNIGFSFSAYLAQGVFFTFGYDLNFKKGVTYQVGILKFRWEFGGSPKALSRPGCPCP